MKGKVLSVSKCGAGEYLLTVRVSVEPKRETGHHDSEKKLEFGRVIYPDIEAIKNSEIELSAVTPKASAKPVKKTNEAPKTVTAKGEGDKGK